MNDPTMPERPPVAALKAIDQIKGFRSWEAVEMYRAIRDVLERHEYSPESGRTP